MTVEELYKICEEQIKKGNANKKVLVSDDEEGNGFHYIFFGFAENLKDYDSVLYNIEKKEYKDHIILG